MVFDLLLLSAAVLLNSRTAAAADTPCASVSSMSADYVSLYPSATVALVPATAAAACLDSIPVQKDEDIALIEEMQYYINWQSNLAYLVEPPEGYTEERVDVLDEMKKVTDGLNNDEFESEYDVMYNLSMALTKAYDFHFAFTPDILQVFRFRRGNIGGGLLDEFALVSVSEDGKSVPKLYNYYDIMVAQDEGWNPSPITEINNSSAEDYIQNWSTQFVYHEDHARYNRLFPNQAQISMGSRINQFGRSNFPDGRYTVVKHDNGSVSQYLNNAIVELDTFDGVEDADTFFERFCNLGPPSSDTSSKKKRNAAPLPWQNEASKVKRQDEQDAEPTATGFPTPEILHSEGVIGGYYLSGQGYEDVAVLSVPSFSPETEDGPQEFQDLTGSFIQAAADAGKKKLVIDLRGNGGGFVFLGYDMFKQLFPSMDPYGASQFRANEAFDEVGQLMAENVFDALTYEDALTDVEENGLGSSNGYGILYQSIFNYKLPLTVENKNFTSWQDYFGPHKFNNDNFTSISRKDLNNFFSDDLTLDVTGYRTRADKLNKKQPFEAENIVLLQDGGCGSTCAVFSEFMKSQGGVQQVVVGGKPETGAMQGVSGSKGSQVYSWTQVYQEIGLVYENLPEQQEQLNETDVGKTIYATRPLMRTAYQANGNAASVVNLRDNIRENDTDATPLEFVYEAADCRVFYTANMVRDTTMTWKKAVDAHWGDASKTCVEGSTQDGSSISGGSSQQQQDKEGAAPRMGVSGVLAALIAMLFAFSMM